MNQKSILRYGFFTFSILNILGNGIDNSLLINITKPFLLLSLLGYYVASTNNSNTFIIVALAFSWLGDVLLMFQEKNSLFFILGLVAFLIAHIFYCIYFYNTITKKSKLNFNIIKLVGVLVYIVLFLFFIQSKLGSMLVPVIIYALVIGSMLLLSLHTHQLVAHQLFVIGAVLFTLSDTILAVNKFHTTLPNAGLFIMLTYVLAQYFLIKGALKNKQ